MATLSWIQKTKQEISTSGINVDWASVGVGVGWGGYNILLGFQDGVAYMCTCVCLCVLRGFIRLRPSTINNISVVYAWGQILVKLFMYWTDIADIDCLAI